MPIRLSGINSGLDTDAIVKELVSAYSLKTEKYEKQKTKLEWKQDAWKNLNTKIYGLYTSVSNLRFDSSYNLKRTSVSDSTKATVTATSDAVTGTQKLQILATAQASYITGAKLDGEYKKTSTLKDLGYTGDATTIKVKSKDKETEIEITGDMKIAELTSKFLEAGVNASYDEKNARFFLSAKESGAANDFTLVADTAAGNEVLAALGLTSSGGKRDALLSQANAYNATLTEIEELKARYGEDFDFKASITAYEAAEKQLAARKSLEAISQAVKNAENANDTFSASGLMNAVKDGKNVEEYLKECGLTEEEIKAVSADVKTISGYSTSQYGGILSKTAATMEAELEAIKGVYDDANKYVKLQEKVEATSETIKAIAADNSKVDDYVDDTNIATKIEGKDAVIVLNNVTYTNASNSFSINGLTIDAQAVTDGEITITTSVDTQGIYDKIKDFLTEYNNVINEITKLYNAEAAKDYEPLTDEERDAMSDEQIEKWEGKIKSALLRRDNSLGSIMNAMVNSMSQSFEVNGQKLSLGNFGISTLGFLNAAENEQYAYHIDGDEDDENTSGKKDKLMLAIQENPDQLMEFMKQLTSNLYTAIDNKMKSTELSSAYKVYNDKEMDKEAKEIENLIKKWNEKIADQEDAYYKKFSQMEVALSKLQSQTNSLSGLLGQ